MKFTADTITDDEIVALRAASKYGTEEYHAATDALHTLDSISLPARARCAEILNARAANGGGQ